VIWILVALILAGVMAAVLLLRDDAVFFFEVCGLFLAIVTGITSLVYVYAAWDWLASEHKANIINREYGTKYTQQEVFYASDVIDTIRQLDRKRIELNGDLMREKERAK
jgi:hypothetical protein